MKHHVRGHAVRLNKRAKVFLRTFLCISKSLSKKCRYYIFIYMCVCVCVCVYVCVRCLCACACVVFVWYACVCVCLGSIRFSDDMDC
jgi:hypothetical protein